MPLDSVQSNISKPMKNKKSSIPRALSAVESDTNQIFSSMFRSNFESESVIPALLKTRLHDLFLQIEKEFESLCSENISCMLISQLG